jgi:hypothetical protein
MRKNQCINCGQMLKPAPADSEYTWIAKADGKESCYAGATLVNGEMVSNQDHCTESEMA